METFEHETEDRKQSARDRLSEIVTTVTRQRQRDLLVLYYPGSLSIADGHIEILHELLNEEGLEREDPLHDLDIILHTTGGNPVAAYRLAQVIRDFTRRATFLVPQYAYSGGTLMCLAGDEVMLGDYAVLSPIDITVERQSSLDDEEPKFPEEGDTHTEIELVAIDHFINAAVQARIAMEREFRQRNWTEARSDAESAMLREMVSELGVLQIAKIYREKNITREYARELLSSYMLSGARKPRIELALRRLVVENPSHEFDMDYHLCLDIGLRVSEMSSQLSKATKELVKHLEFMAHEDWIGKTARGAWIPFFQFFQYTAPTQTPVNSDIVAIGERGQNGKGEDERPESRQGQEDAEDQRHLGDSGVPEAQISREP